MRHVACMGGRKTHIRLKDRDQLTDVGMDQNLKNKNNGYIRCNKLLRKVIPPLCVGRTVTGSAQDLLLVCW